MAKLAELRKKAKGLGIGAAVIRRATTASELQAAIDAHSGSSKPKAKAKAKGKGKAPVARKQTRSAPAKKNSGRKASTPAKSKGAKAKRSSNSTSTREPKGGRNLLGKVNFSKTDGWNPRDGSPVDLIVKSLKKHKGDREKVFQALKGDIWNFVAKKKQNGDKRTKAEAEKMLRYRISRTAFDFAVRTGQHEPSDNRVEYGTGGTGEGTFKRAGSKPKTKPKSKAKTAKAKTPARKPAAKKAGRKPAAKKGRKVKARR